MELTIDNEKLAELVADKITDDYAFRERVRDGINARMEKAINDGFKELGTGIISEAMEKVSANWKEIKLRRTNNWGDPQGGEISLPQWCEEMILEKSKAAYGSSELHKSLREVVGQTVAKHIDEIVKREKAHIERFVKEAIAAKLQAKVGI